MERHIIDERTGIHYTLVGDYYLPELSAPEPPQIGVWGKRHYDYLHKYKHLDYELMLISGKLNAYLESIDRQAEELLSQLINDMAQQEGITEALKEADQMEWVRCMNSIRNRAEEIVYREVIYT